MLGFELLGLRIRPMALQAQSVGSLGTQQVIVLAAVGLVAGGASLLECRLMHKVLLALVGQLAMTAQADVDRIGLGQAGLTAGMRIVAVGAISCRSRMLHFRLLNLLRLLAVAGYADR